MEPITGFTSKALAWSHKPSEFKVDSASGELEICGDTGKDYWSRTYYSPCLIKNDAPALLATVPADQEVTLELSFTLRPVEQFDQGGALVLVDSQTWVKCGIEYCDGAPRLSCVVCNEGFADWSTQKLDGMSLRLRVHKLLPGPDQGPCMVFEVARPEPASDTAPDQPPSKKARTEVWTFVRIASLRSKDKPWQMGPFAASPMLQRGGRATFHSMRIGPKLATAHSDDPGHQDCKQAA